MGGADKDFLFDSQGRGVRKRQAREGEIWWEGAAVPGWRRGGFGMPARGVLLAGWDTFLQCLSCVMKRHSPCQRGERLDGARSWWDGKSRGFGRDIGSLEKWCCKQGETGMGRECLVHWSQAFLSRQVGGCSIGKVTQRQAEAGVSPQSRHRAFPPGKCRALCARLPPSLLASGAPSTSPSCPSYARRGGGRGAASEGPASTVTQHTWTH